MTEGTPPTMEQTRQLNRSLTEKVLDRAASDPQWKQQLIDDPEAALREANFPELTMVGKKIRQSAADSQDAYEVRGHFYCPWECLAHTMAWYQASWSIVSDPSTGVFEQ